MTRFLRTALIVVAGLWTGGLLALGAVAAPAIFGAAPSRPVAGGVFGAILLRFDKVELVFAAAALLGAAALTLRSKRRRPWLSLALSAVLAVLACLTAFGVHPAVVSERSRVGNFDALPDGDPSKARFDALHRTSVRLSGAKLLLGLLLLGGAAWRPAEPDPHGV